MTNNRIHEAKSLNPFTKFLMTIGELPTSYLISMTYEEQLVWLCNYLKETVIPVVNNNSEAVKELQEWFVNLDVQDEINNKLEEMEKSGELQEIIIEYLQIKGLLGFDTVADMKVATNLIDGSICRTLGVLDYLDGKGEFYKVRTLTNEDVIDEVNIIALTNYPTLIAELIPDYYRTNLQSQITDNYNTLDNKIDTVNSNLNTKIDNLNVNEDYYIIIGDSYATGHGSAVNFINEFKTNMGLDNNHLFSNCMNGSGFVNRPEGNKIYIELLQDLAETMTTAQKNSITKLIVEGFMNDRGKATSSIVANIQTFYNYVKTTFPKAQMYLFDIGRSSRISNMESYRTNLLPALLEAEKFGIIYIKNANNILHKYDLFLPDSFHPTDEGSRIIAQNLANGVKTGSVNPRYLTSGLITNVITPYGSANDFGTAPNLKTKFSNGYAQLFTESLLYVGLNQSVPVADGTVLTIGKYETNNAMCCHPQTTNMMIPVTGKIVGSKNGVWTNTDPLFAFLYFTEDENGQGLLKIRFGDYYANNKYSAVPGFELDPFTGICEDIYC